MVDEYKLKTQFQLFIYKKNQLTIRLRAEFCEFGRFLHLARGPHK